MHKLASPQGFHIPLQQQQLQPGAKGLVYTWYHSLCYRVKLSK